MALSSDEIIKQEIVKTLGVQYGRIHLCAFPQTSRQDQDIFSQGGLTFGYNGVLYGSCDACWYINEEWTDGYDGSVIDRKPVIALEGTDALNRKSSGNAQYQRFHHALGAVKNGVIGIYYLKKGRDRIRPDLFGMAFFASKFEDGVYLVIDDLKVVKDILSLYETPAKLEDYINAYLDSMYSIFNNEFNRLYAGSWEKFAKRRSTVIKDNCVIKYAARMKRNFTEGSQRAGHIAVGEMYLTKYYFYNKKFYYLFLKMTSEELDYLDIHKANDKEWYLLRHEPNVEIRTIDDIIGLNPSIRDELIMIKDDPLNGGETNRIYNKCAKSIFDGLRNGSLDIKE